MLQKNPNSVCDKPSCSILKPLTFYSLYLSSAETPVSSQNLKSKILKGRREPES